MTVFSLEEGRVTEIIKISAFSLFRNNGVSFQRKCAMDSLKT